MSTVDLAHYPYTHFDLERLRPSQLRAGDVMAMAGPQGSGRFAGNPVLSVRPLGVSPSWRDETFEITYRSRWGEVTLHQPEQFHVYRIRAERIHPQES